MLWIATAWALDPLYDCPTVSVPADALVYRSSESAEALIDDIAALAEPYVSANCDWVETVEEDSWGKETGRSSVCDGPDYRVEIVSGSWDGGDSGGGWYELLVTAPEPWVELDYRVSWFGAWFHSPTSELGSSVSWVGSVEGLPDGGELSVHRETTGEAREPEMQYAVETTVTSPLCDWAFGDIENAYLVEGDYAYVEGGGHTVTVYDVWMCTTSQVYATFDDVRIGNVDPDTWELYPDADGDTYGGAADCDDTSATVNECATEVEDDGIDQDCDGADALDTDGDLDDDGHDGIAAGGADCDDADPAVHPQADDPPDGVDTDCDGADDVDADGDGYTADGDNRAADCDDADPLIFRGADEVPQDGIDQDCDGVDDLDADRDGADTPADCDDADPEIGPLATDWACDRIDQDCDGVDPCENPGVQPEAGCGSPAWVFLLPLGLGMRRRSQVTSGR
jgi:hypothetical protein